MKPRNFTKNKFHLLNPSEVLVIKTGVLSTLVGLLAKKHHNIAE